MPCRYATISAIHMRVVVIWLHSPVDPGPSLCHVVRVGPRTCASVYAGGHGCAAGGVPERAWWLESKQLAPTHVLFPRFQPSMWSLLGSTTAPHVLAGMLPRLKSSKDPALASYRVLARVSR